MYDFEPFHYDIGVSRRGKGYIAGELPRHTPDELNLLYLQQVLATCRVLPNTFSNMHKHWKCGRNAKVGLFTDNYRINLAYFVSVNLSGICQ